TSSHGDGLTRRGRASRPPARRRGLTSQSADQFQIGRQTHRLQIIMGEYMLASFYPHRRGSRGVVQDRADPVGNPVDIEEVDQITVAEPVDRFLNRRRTR